MAVKIYGVSTGSSANKYDLWLEITENSQNTANNKSNVTVKLKLKRNDGYSSSAYNLNESENEASINLAGVLKKKVNLAIDTRNSVVVTLVSYTGDVSHNADGTLNLSVKGNFKMSGTSLSGGSVSGTFKCVTIPRTSSFTVDKTTFSPGESVTATISAYSTVFTHKLIWQIGSYKKTVNVAANVSNSTISIPFDWVNAVPNSKKGIVTVTLNTYNSTTLIGKTVKTLSLSIPETSDFKPDFNVVTENIKLFNSDTVNVYIKNKSRLKVTLSNLSLKYGATQTDVTAEFLSLKRKTLPCEFAITGSGNLTLKVKLTDSRGFTTEKTQTITVYDYSPPTISIEKLVRCDSSGTSYNSGTAALINFKYSFSNVNNLNTAIIKLRYKKEVDSNFSTYKILSSSPVILNENFVPNAAYVFELSIADSLTETPFCITRSLMSSEIPFNIKKGGNGAAFGCYSENENELTVGYNLNITGELKYENLNDAAILNDTYFIKAFLKIKNFSGLRTVFIQGEFIAKTQILANRAYQVFALSRCKPPIKTPLAILTQTFNSDRNFLGFIDSQGYLIIIGNKTLEVGERIHFWCVYNAREELYE